MSRSNEWLELPQDGVWNAPARPRLVEALLARYPCLPPDYIAFLRRSDGGSIEGVGVWDTKLALEINARYDECEASTLFAFASENDERYCFDLRPGCKGAVVQMPDIGFNWDDAWYVAPTFLEFVRLAKLEGEWFEASEAAEDAKAWPSLPVTQGDGLGAEGQATGAKPTKLGILGSLQRLFAPYRP